MATKHLDQSVDEFAPEYTSSLKKYLRGGEEEALQNAYEIGRAVVLSGLGILDITELYHRALESALRDMSPSMVAGQMEKALIFFKESLSPFEITHRGYWDAMEVRQHVADFAYIACHEVKGPLTSILSSTSMLEELLDADQYSHQGRLIANILRGVAILQSRTKDMMDIAGFYSGALSIQPRLVDMYEFLQQVFEHLEPEVQGRGMTFGFHVSGDISMTKIDPDRIEQVITNLVQNAVKYAAEGGNIALKANTLGEYVIVEVQDHGRGIPLEQQKALFASDRPIGKDNRAQGTGLGLILCKQIVEAHHGKIRLASRHQKGSTFEIWLPLVGDLKVKENDIESINR